MLFGLFYLFNNKLEIDSLKAIDAIKEKAENDLLVDTLLMSNSIKNLIKETKKDVIIQTSSNTNTSPGPARDSSVGKSQSFIRKISNEINAPININLNFKPLAQTSLKKESSADLDSLSSNATKQNESGNSLTDVYQPSATRRASIKIIQQQQIEQQISSLNKTLEQADLDSNSTNSKRFTSSESSEFSNMAGKIPPIAHIDSINSIPNMDNDIGEENENSTYSERL
jgi:hypothetical protein